MDNLNNILSPDEIAERVKSTAKTQHIVLYEMLDALDMGKNTLSHWKHGRIPSVYVLARIAEYLGCTVNDLIYRGNDTPK